MAEPAVFLIHGLGGTQYDLGSMHKRLKNAGFVTYSITLPGHGGQPSDLLGVRAEDWLEAVRAKYREIVDQHEVLHVMGMCMGSLLAIETCKRERHDKGRLVGTGAAGLHRWLVHALVSRAAPPAVPGAGRDGPDARG
ncbi:alpha/beta hydrolase [Roseateles sp. UC29_93]|uniref:alpha/beta hydrolase n=1 Tax=Roseateles sp. UC29_93 TaxID=3350177 RepID=UPI003671A437